jgi:hypothetical protein
MSIIINATTPTITSLRILDICVPPFSAEGRFSHATEYSNISIYPVCMFLTRLVCNSDEALAANNSYSRKSELPVLHILGNSEKFWGGESLG